MTRLSDLRSETEAALRIFASPCDPNRNARAPRLLSKKGSQEEGFSGAEAPFPVVTVTYLEARFTTA